MTIIKSFAVGNGDMYYIKHNSDNFSMIDCCLSDENSDQIIAEVKRESAGKRIVRFISSHPDQDHIGGLVHLDDSMSILNFYCVENEAKKDDPTSDFNRYCALRDSTDKAFYLFKGCKRKWMNEGDSDRGAAGLHVYWPDLANAHFQKALKDAKDGESPNNIGPILRYSLQDGASALWIGDLESEYMENIENELDIPPTTILFAPHHGRKSGLIPSTLLSTLAPKVIVIGEAHSEHLHYYPGYDHITQNSAGELVFDCVERMVHVYVSEPGYSVDFLVDHSQPNSYGYYIGTLEL